MALSALVDRYDQLILDLDGCVWVGDEPLPGAVEAVNALREAGKRVAFVTNDPRHALEDHVRKLWRIGLRASLAELDGVHRVATGRVKPRMGSGRPVAPISKVRRVESGLSITINTEGAIVDAYVVTDRPDEVEAAMRERGWTA